MNYAHCRFTGIPNRGRKSTIPKEPSFSVSYVPQHGEGIKEAVQSGVDLVKSAIAKIPTPRDGPSPKVREFLSKYGSSNVLSTVRISRKPINSMISKVLNILSLGTLFKQQKKLGYDDLFHLYLFVNIKLPSGKGATVRMEKNHVVEMSINSGVDSGESRLAPTPGMITLTDFISNGEKLQGPSFWQYDASNNNCQVFVYTLLKANGIATPELKTFILQDAKALMTPFLSKFSKKITDIAGGLDRLIFGQGAGFIEGQDLL